LRTLAFFDLDQLDFIPARDTGFDSADGPIMFRSSVAAFYALLTIPFYSPADPGRRDRFITSRLLRVHSEVEKEATADANSVSLLACP